MGNYDNIVKTEEIRKKVEEGDFLSAQTILDSMDLKKIKSISDLNLLAEVYKENERYEEATGLYLRIYEKSRTRKTISQLVDIYIKRGNAKEAQEFLNEYQKVSSEDFDSIVFRYKLEKLKGASYEQLIESLLMLKKIEYTEKWAYELAKLYYKAGMETECIKECSDIVLWFGEGTYVEKAKMLRSYYSGETDREKMIEKLKHKPEEESHDYPNEPVEEVETGDSEDIYSESDFMKDNNDEFETGLSKDIQNMMSYEEFEEQTQLEGQARFEEQTRLEGQAPEEVALPDEETTGFGELDQENEAAELRNQYREYEMSETEEEFGEDDTAVYEDQYREGEITGSEEQIKEDDEVETEENDTGYNPSALTANVNSDFTVAKEVNEPVHEVVLDEEDLRLKQLGEEYNLNPEEIFDNFLHVVSVKKQIVKGLETILQDSKKAVFMIITGAEGSGKTTLAKDMALLLSKAGRIKSSKVAKITAQKLNTVDIDSKKETLKSCCLVVENASDLKRTTIDRILELTKQLKGDIAVVFEEDKKNMNKLFRECPSLMDLLRVRIHLPQYTQEDLRGFAIACLKQKDYRLNPGAETVLARRMDQIARQSEPHTCLAQIYDLMQAAMNSADVRTGKKLTDLAAQGRLKEVELLEVLPEDFKA